jgi:hypothetical protein
MAEMYFVRLKPFNPAKGHLTRRHWCHGLTFHESRGWYRVTKEVADRLRAETQNPTNPNAPMLFDVCAESEAKEMERREKLQERQRRTVEEALPIVDAATGAMEPGFDLTTTDLPAADLPPPPDLPTAKPAPRPATGRDRRRGR